MGKGDVSDTVSERGQSVLDDVLSAPIPKPEPPAQAPVQKGAHTKKVERINMQDVIPEDILWLWDRRLARGKFTLIDGDPGEGKSLIMLDIAARLSTGRPMPDETTANFGPSKVLFLLCEDDLADTVAPRLIAADADRANIEVIRELLKIPGQLDTIEEAIREMGAALVVIDPLNGYIDGKINTHSDHEVRMALTPLVEMAARSGAAIIGVRHLNKQVGGPAKYRGGGSIAYIGLARAGLMVGIDPEDESVRILASSKGNLSTPAPSLRFAIAETANKQPRIEWKGKCDLTADDLCAPPEKEDSRSARKDAQSFLIEELANGPRYADELYQEAEAQHISARTLRRVRAAEGVIQDRDGRRWKWTLPAQPASRATLGARQ